MGRILKQLSFILILVVLSGQTALAVSKSQSKYTGNALMSSESDVIGFNLHWAQKCNFGGDFNIANEVARLSWYDFTSFNSGWSRMNNSTSSGCTSDAKQEVLSDKKRYLAELKNKVNQKLGISSSTQTASSSSLQSNNSSKQLFNERLKSIDFYPINETEVISFLKEFNIDSNFPKTNKDTDLFLEAEKFEKGGAYGIDYAKAHEYYEKDLKLNGNLKSVFYTSMGFWYGDGVPVNYKKSLFLSLIGVEFDKAYANYSRAAMNFRKLGEIKKAIKFLEDSIKIKYDYIYGNLLLGEIYFEEEGYIDFNKAKKYFEVSLKYNKDKGHTYYQRASSKLKIVNEKINTLPSTQVASNEFSSWTDQQICSFAKANGKWVNYPSHIQYVKEAKRRGLSCSLGSSQQTASSDSLSNTNNTLALQQANQKAQQAQTEAQLAKKLAQQSEQDAQQAKQLAQQAQSETESERKKRIELEKQLADLKAQQQKKQQQITQDNQIPLIAAMAYNDTDTNAIIEGIITDNVEVAEVTVDNQLVPLNTDGSFQTNLYIPRNGKTVEIVAFDLKGNKAIKTIQLNRNAIEEASGPVFASLNPSGKRVKPNPNALALIIGVADYEKTPAKAVYADSDAQIFYDYAMLKLGIPASNITELVNEGAEETDILLAIKKWIARSTQQGESDIYIFFAGHGLASSNGKDMYLLPYDGSPELLEKTAILREELFKDIASTNPRSVTVFLDTCYSGTTRGTDMLIASRPIAIVAKEQAIPDNFTVFTATAGDQTAKPLEEAKHGLFSYFLMKGMEGEADRNKDNAITASELHAYVQQNVIQQSSGSQTPELQGDANRVLVSFQ